MKALPILLFAFLAVCSMPSALALECYACTNVPGFGGSKCDSDSIEKITCPPFANRCFTMKYSMNIGDTSVDLMMRNCTNSMACDPKSDLYTCTLMNSSGLFSNCELKCCEGNLCDPYKVDVTTTTTVILHTSAMTTHAPDVTRPSTQPTSAVSVFAASFGAILVAFVLNMFASFS